MVYAKGMGEYSGESEVRQFEIVDSNSLQAAKVTFEDPGFAESHVLPYTGQKATPAFRVEFSNTQGNVLLVEGSDYVVSYTRRVLVEEDGYSYWNWVENEAPTIPGSYSCRVKPADGSSYTSSYSFDYSICKSLANATVNIAGQTYTGRGLTPEATVTLDGVVLGKGVDYSISFADNTNAGTATATITGMGSYVGAATSQFVIAPASIDKAALELADASFTFTGDEIKPQVKTVGGKELQEGVDYSVEYADNVNAGTVTAKVMGKGNYAGVATAQFTISPASIASAVVSGVEDAAYTGSAITQSALSVALGGKELKEGVDYSVEYADNVNAGTAKVTVTGLGNYTGTATAQFTISPAQATPISIEGAALVLSKANFTFTGKVQKPTVKTVGGKELKEGVDYTAVYSDASSKNAGSYTVKAVGKGDYAGTSALAEYAISKAKNALSAKANVKSVKLSKVKKKAQTVTKGITVSKAQGKVTYAKVAKGSSNALSIDKTSGKISVKKGTKKGTYKIKVKITAKGNANYKSGSKTVTAKVTVK